MKHLELFLWMHCRKWEKKPSISVSKRSLEEEPVVLCMYFMLFLFEAGIHGFFSSQEREVTLQPSLCWSLWPLLLLLLLLLSD